MSTLPVVTPVPTSLFSHLLNEVGVFLTTVEPYQRRVWPKGEPTESV